MVEEDVQKLFRGQGPWQVFPGKRPQWWTLCEDKVQTFRRSWRIAESATWELFYEVILVYYEKRRNPDLPEPAPLPGTPQNGRNGAAPLKQTKDTLKLGERLLVSKYGSLRSDLIATFDTAKRALEAKVTEAVEKSKSPLAKEIQKLQSSKDQAIKTSEKLRIEEQKLSEQVNILAEKQRRELHELKAKRDEAKQLHNSAHYEIENIDVDLDSKKRKHREEVKAKFQEAETQIEMERNRILRDLEVQKENEVDNLWAKHLPEPVRKMLDRVPEVTTVTGELPNNLQKLIEG
jgi:hypothetical protein